MVDTLTDVWQDYGPAALLGSAGGTVLGGLQALDPVLTMLAGDGRFWIAIASLASSELPRQVPSISDQTGTYLLVGIVATVVIGKLYVRYGKDD